MFFRHRKPKTAQKRHDVELAERAFLLLPEPPAPEISTLFPADFAPTPLATMRLPFFKSARQTSVVVNNSDELTAAISAEQPRITLGSDIALTEALMIDYDLSINLNDHSLLSEQTAPGARVLDILHGHVVITGPGKIFTLSEDGTVIRVFGAKNPGTPDYASLTISAGVKLYTPEGYGIVIAANLDAAYGLTINFAGEIIARTGISVHATVQGLPTIHILDGARIVTDETSGCAIDAAGRAIWQIDAAELSGYTGLQAVAGDFNFVDSQIFADGPALVLGDLTSTAVVPATPSLTIDGGNYVSHTGITIIGTSEVEQLHILRGDFCGPVGVINQDLTGIIVAEDGHFTTDIAKFGEEPTADDLREPIETPAELPATPFSATLIDELDPAYAER